MSRRHEKSRDKDQSEAIMLTLAGTGTTFLKKLCRKYGVEKWPQRKLRSIEKKIETLKAEQVCMTRKMVRAISLEYLILFFMLPVPLLSSDTRLKDGGTLRVKSASYKRRKKP